MIILENESFRVEINPFGAELSSFRSKKTGTEYVWGGDPAAWKRHAPVLFPIVGRLKDKTYTVGGASFEITQHGFGRDLEWEPKQVSGTCAEFTLTQSEYTKRMYPWDFTCTLRFTLDGGSLSFGDLAVATDAGSGTVYAKGDVPKQARSRFGLVFQNYNLFPHYTVMKNITDAPIRVLKRPREQVEARACELIAQMGLTGNENKVPCELSGGQQQRVSIARALALDPEILFFDEPTSALDPELTAEVLRVIKDLAAQNMTMVIVTHAMQFARDVADRVVFMDGGRIVEEGPAKQVIDHPREQRTREFLSRIES